MTGEPQTRSRIQRLLGARGLNPRRDLGQNFLIDLNLVRFVAGQARLGEGDVALEIGAGLGSLTSELALDAGVVIAVEYDRNLYELAQQALATRDNVTLIHSDALAGKHHLAPVVLEAVSRQLAAAPDRRLKLVANLPYNVGTPVISNLVASDLPWELMVVTIQHELAERMQAGPSTSNYGALSVWLQAQCKIEILRKLPSTVFWPQPKVDSAVVRISPNPEKRASIRDRAFFHEYLRVAFGQRRKQLRGLLSGVAPNLDKSAAAELLVKVCGRENTRAEELDIALHIELSNRLESMVRAQPAV